MKLVQPSSLGCCAGKRRKKQDPPAADGAAACGSGIAAPAPHSKIDYSKFDKIEDSDEDDYDKYANDMACRPGCPFHGHDCASDHPLAEDDEGGSSEADDCVEDFLKPSPKLGVDDVKNGLEAKWKVEMELHAQQQGVKGLGNSTLPTASKKKPALRQGFFNFGGSKPVHETVSQPNAASTAPTHTSPAGKELQPSEDNESDGPPPLQDGENRRAQPRRNR